MKARKQFNLGSSILSAAVALAALVTLVLATVTVLDYQDLGINYFTQESKQSSVDEIEITIAEAIDVVNTTGVTVVGSQTYRYDHAHREEFTIIQSNDPTINCSLTIVDAVSGGCYHYASSTLVLSTHAGSGAMLKALVLHEFAHYLQTQTPEIGLEPLTGDTAAEYECLADSLAVELGADVEWLGYTSKGECTHTPKRTSIAFVKELNTPEHWYEILYEELVQITRKYS